MLDLIFVVDDSTMWHRKNIENNPHHYSLLQHVGVDKVTSIQRACAGVYYNTLVQISSEVSHKCQ